MSERDVDAAARTSRYQDVLAAFDEDRLIEWTRDVLSIPSPPGEEEAVARRFVDIMQDVGMDAGLQPVPETELMGASFNALGRITGTRSGAESLMFNGHIDHNPTSAGWTVDPFAAEIRDGSLYGFVHMKAACAGYIAAVDACRRAGVEIAGDVVLALVCGELRGGAGTQALIRDGVWTNHFVLGEPTDLQLGLRHTTSIVLDVDIVGQMKHYATVLQKKAVGWNAVEVMSRLIPRIGESHQPLPTRAEGGWLTFDRSADFPGLPQLNVGSIRGGIGPTYDRSRPALFPDRCTLTLDMRPVPGMSRASIKADLEALVDQILREEGFEASFDVRFEPATFEYPFIADPGSRVVQATLSSHDYVSGSHLVESEELLYAASDASWLSRAGMSGVIYGPSGKYLSRPDERCDVEDLITAAKVYACILADVAGT